MKSGIYSDISNDEYHKGPGISKSGLDIIARSPLHYWGAYLDPNKEPRKETPAMAFGTAIHTAILEPETYDARYTVMPDGLDRRTKIGKEQYEAYILQSQTDGTTLIGSGEHAKVMKVAEQARDHPLARRLLETGKAEQSVYWTDPETGILCKARPDWLIDPNPNCAILDVKSTQDASPEGFMKSAFNYRYHVQAAWYLDGLEAATGWKPDAFMFLALEKDAPFASAFYYASDAMIDVGRREYRKALNTYAACLESGKWPGYSSQLQALELPRWAEIAIEKENDQ